MSTNQPLDFQQAAVKERKRSNRRVKTKHLEHKINSVMERIEEQARSLNVDIPRHDIAFNRITRWGIISGLLFWYMDYLRQGNSLLDATNFAHEMARFASSIIHAILLCVIAYQLVILVIAICVNDTGAKGAKDNPWHIAKYPEEGLLKTIGSALYSFVIFVLSWTVSYLILLFPYGLCVYGDNLPSGMTFADPMGQVGQVILFFFAAFISIPFLQEVKNPVSRYPKLKQSHVLGLSLMATIAVTAIVQTILFVNHASAEQHSTFYILAVTVTPLLVKLVIGVIIVVGKYLIQYFLAASFDKKQQEEAEKAQAQQAAAVLAAESGVIVDIHPGAGGGYIVTSQKV